MKRRAWVQEHAGRIALTVLLLCLIVYTVYHAFRGSSDGLLTSPAREITDTRLIGGEAWLFRDEQLLLSDREGLVNPIAKSGSKVGRNTALAEIWTGGESSSLAERQEELDAINRMIFILEQSLLPEGSTVSHAERYRTEALAALQEIRETIRSGNWSALGSLEERMLILLNRYGALTGAAGDVEKALQTAKEERSELLDGSATVLYNGESSAYFYGRACVDGFEQIFTREALDSITSERFAALRAGEAKAYGGTVAGKLCYDYAWYLAMELTDGAEAFLSEQTAYSFRFPENDGISLVLTCERILSEDGGVIAIFRSEDCPADFQYLRSQRVEITVGSVSGFHIPEQTLVWQDGTWGVYVFEDSTVRFRRVEVISEEEGYVIASQTDPNPSHAIAYLGANDLIVTSGKNLYDGKVYR